MRRDTVRIERLREMFSEVFTLSKDTPSDVKYEKLYHLPHKMCKGGATKLSELIMKEHSYLQVNTHAVHTPFCTPTPPLLHTPVAHPCCTPLDTLHMLGVLS